MLNLTFTGPTEEVLDDLRRIMPALLGATPLPPMQEQPKDDAQPQRTRRTRKDKEAGEAEAGESADTKTASSQETKTETSDSSAETADTKSLSEVPSIDDLRASLKKLGGTDGHGSDAVFKLLGEYDAKNASTVPEGKRAEVIAKIDEMLKGGAK